MFKMAQMLELNQPIFGQSDVLEFIARLFDFTIFNFATGEGRALTLTNFNEGDFLCLFQRKWLLSLPPIFKLYVEYYNDKINII